MASYVECGKNNKCEKLKQISHNFFFIKTIIFLTLHLKNILIHTKKNKTMEMEYDETGWQQPRPKQQGEEEASYHKKP